MKLLKRLIFILLLIDSFTSHAFDQELHFSDNAINRHPHQVPSHSTSPRRTVRAADALSSEVEKMQMVVRVATGTSFQVGFSDGDISSDELISGLLNLGDFSARRLIAMSSTKLQNVFSSITELSEKLKADNSSGGAEEKLKALDEIRTVIGGFDVMKWEGRQHFKEEMMILKSWQERKGVGDLDKSIDSCNFYYEEIKNMKPDDNKLLHYINNLNYYSEESLKLLKNVAAFRKRDWRYKKIQNATYNLRSVIKTVEAVKTAVAQSDKLQFQSKDTDDLNAYIRKMESLSNVSTSLPDVFPWLQLAKKIVLPRQSQVGTFFAYGGFQNGSSDIDKIFLDLKNSWMKKSINADRVTDWLKPLQSLIPSLAQVENALGSVAEEPNIKQFLGIVDGIQSTSLDPNKVKTILQRYLKCSEVFTAQKKVNTTAISEFLDSAFDLDNEMKKINEIVSKFTALVDKEEVRSWLEKAIELSVTSNDTSQRKATMEKIQQSEELDKLSKVATEASGLYLRLAAYSIEDTAERLGNETASIDLFQRSLSDYLPFYHCLQDINQQDGKLVANILSTIQNVMTFEKKVLTDGQEFVKEVAKTSTDFKALGDVIGKMKKIPSAELTALRPLPDIYMHSKTLGTAVCGISAMKAAIDRKDQTEKIIRSVELVKLYLKNSQLDQKDKDILQKLVDLRKPLEAMYAKLGEWRDAVKKTDSTVLADRANLFITAKKVPGISANLDDMAKSIGNLTALVVNQTEKDQLLDVQKSLDSLATIDLNFAAYKSSFSASEASLKVLDKFFADLRRAPKTTDQSRYSFGRRKSNGTTAITPWLLWSSIGASVIIITLSIVLLIYCITRKERKKNKKTNLDSEW